MLIMIVYITSGRSQKEKRRKRCGEERRGNDGELTRKSEEFYSSSGDERKMTLKMMRTQKREADDHDVGSPAADETLL